jgi:UPF0176 protein
LGGFLFTINFSQPILVNQLFSMDSEVQVITFYQFAKLPDFEQLQPSLEELCESNALKGTVILAPEGINGAIAGTRSGIAAFKHFWQKDQRFANLEYKHSIALKQPFQRLKIKLKPEIITLGIPELDPTQQVGTHISAKQWNQLLQDPELILIDTRNQYEIEIGSFVGAINPEIDSFREFPDYVEQHLDPNQHSKIAMFCTGGIRCEKASALLLKMGFAEVYQLDGGILKYLEQVDPAESRWEGECFVFDDRVALDQQLSEGSYKQSKGQILAKNELD